MAQALEWHPLEGIKTISIFSSHRYVYSYVFRTEKHNFPINMFAKFKNNFWIITRYNDGNKRIQYDI